MAEGFEPYHVPQQSRRDKLRVVATNHLHPQNLHGCAPLPPNLYDLDFANLHRQSFNLPGVKEEGVNSMGFLGAIAPNHLYADPSVHLNPNSIHDISGGGPFAYYRPVIDQYEGQNGNNTESLSLSLSSHHHRYDSSVFGGSKVGEEYVVGCNNGGSGSGSGSVSTLSKSAVPLGPFTGYASVLKGSRFLRPAQQLLQELCVIDYADRDGVGGESSLLDPPSLSCVDDSVNCSDGGEQTRKKSRLLSLLDEVYKRYKQYYQQMQAAVAAFESVAGLSNAAPFANLALKAMSKHFRILKNAITDQLQFTSKSHGKLNCDQRDEAQRPENSGRAAYGQRPFHAGFVDQPVWRPQRGLPERAVTVLRAWLFDHFLHPYPTDTDKIMLAKQTGLSRNQVSNWFINARVRLWKPMVEEIHMLETRQGQKPSSQRDDQQQQQQQQQQPPNTLNNHLPTSCSMDSQNASTSIQRMGEFPLKRTREDPSENPVQMKLSYDNLMRNNPLLGVGLNNGGNGSGGNGGVSLTLGLHQNGVGLSDSYPINAARRFGLDSQGGQEFVVSGFPVQNRQYGRDIIDGQIMHDFVG